MVIGDAPEWDEKNASLSMTLKADSGFRAKTDGCRVSPNQWARILGVCENPEMDRLFAAAETLLDALIAIEQDIRCAAGCDDDASEAQIDSDVMSWGGSPMAGGYQQVLAAIALATSS